MSGQMYYFTEIENLPLGLSVLNLPFSKRKEQRAMNQLKTARLRNNILAVAAILVILAAGASAQQKLGDLVTESGFDWMIGEWVATTDQGGKIHSSYKWELNKNLITLGFKVGDFEGRGLIYYVPAENKVVQVNVDNRGGIAKGTWDADGDKAVARLEYTPVEGEIRRMASVHSKVDANTMKEEYYTMDSDGRLAEEPLGTYEYKRQKKQAAKKK